MGQTTNADYLPSGLTCIPTLWTSVALLHTHRHKYPSSIVQHISMVQVSKDTHLGRVPSSNATGVEVSEEPYVCAVFTEIHRLVKIPARHRGIEEQRYIACRIADTLGTHRCHCGSADSSRF